MTNAVLRAKSQRTRLSLALVIVGFFLKGCGNLEFGPRLATAGCTDAVDEEFLRADAFRPGRPIDSLLTVPVLTPTNQYTATGSSTHVDMGAPINANAPIFNFSTGLSRFVLLSFESLPSTPRVVYAFPVYSGQTLGSAGCDNINVKLVPRMLRPVLTFLDEQRRPIGVASLGTALTVENHPAVEFSVPKGTKYAAVHYDRTQLGREYVALGARQTVPMLVGVAPVPVSQDTTRVGRAVETGVVGIRLQW